MHTRRDVTHGVTGRRPRIRVAPTAFDWDDVEAVEPSAEPDDGRPALIVRRAAAEQLGVQSAGSAGSARETVRLRIRGDARDVPVLARAIADRRWRRQLGSDESLRIARRLSGEAG